MKIQKRIELIANFQSNSHTGTIKSDDFIKCGIVQMSDMLTANNIFKIHCIFTRCLKINNTHMYVLCT